MKLSVVIPVYKVEPYLERCVRSVYRQTFQDMEIIMVDDGSPDGSGALADLLAAQDVRARVIHQENQGLSGARNTGLRTAQGDYVVFLDSDDEWLLEDGIETLLQNDGTDLIIFKRVHIYEGRHEEMPDYDVEIISSLPDAQSVFSHLIRTNQYSASACLLLFRRQVLVDNEIYFPLGFISEDVFWSLRYWQIVRSAKVVNLNFYGQHHRAGSITATTSIRAYNSFDKIFSYWKKQCHQKCINYETILIYLAEMWVSMSYNYYRIDRKDRPQALSVLIRHADLLQYADTPKSKRGTILAKLFGTKGAVILLGLYKIIQKMIW